MKRLSSLYKYPLFKIINTWDLRYEEGGRGNDMMLTDKEG